MIYEVSASYLFLDTGHVCEQSLKIQFEADTHKEAIVAGVRWGIERGNANEFGSPVCIKVRPYPIGRPEMNGYIRTGGAFDIFEWKYDTSPIRIDNLVGFLVTQP